MYSSIRDGRHREQKKRALDNLQSHQFIYCIEGPHCRLNDMRKKIIDGALLNTMFRDKLRYYNSFYYGYRSINYKFTKKITENPAYFKKKIKVCYKLKIVKYEDLIKLQKKENMTPRVCQTLFFAQIP